MCNLCLFVNPFHFLLWLVARISFISVYKCQFSALEQCSLPWLLFAPPVQRIRLSLSTKIDIWADKWERLLARKGGGVMRWQLDKGVWEIQILPLESCIPAAIKLLHCLLWGQGELQPLRLQAASEQGKVHLLLSNLWPRALGSFGDLVPSFISFPS